MASKFDDPPEDGMPPMPFPPEASSERPKAAVVKLQPKTPQQPQTFPVVWVDRAKLNLDVPQLVKGLIEEGNMCAIYGEPGTGKSFFTADLAQHVAMGKPWRGRRTKKSLVVYVASEAGASIVKRFVAWRDRRLGEAADPLPLAILTRGPDLGNLLDHERLCAQLEELQQEAGLPLGLVIFDTLGRSMPGSDENSSEHMGKATACADLIRDRFKAATIFIHHCGKDPAKGMRGHSSLHGNCDVEIFVEKGLATVFKGRDIVGGERFAFSLEPVEIGVDSDGDQVYTCLLNHEDAPSEAPKAPSIRGIAALALAALREAIEAHGDTMPASSTIPKGVRGVQADVWRERFRLRYGEEKDAGVRAKAFYRAKEQLLSARAVAMSDPWVWISY